MKKERVFEIMRYLSCTVVITTVSWGSYAIFVDKLNMSVFLSNLLSWLLATSLSFFVNKLWVFQSYTFKKDELIKEFITFFTSRIVSGIIEIGGVPLLERIRFDKPFYTLAKKIGLSLEFFFTDGIYSKIFSGIIVLILNYIFAKLLVFRRKSNSNVNGEK